MGVVKVLAKLSLPSSSAMKGSINGFNCRFSGSKYSKDFRVFFEDSQSKLISPFHDIPLKSASNNYHMVVEIPRWTNAKFEISTSEPGNPITQDVKKGEVRFVKNLFPHRGYIWNYGAIPQTWEDPSHKDAGTGAFGDNDPIDAIEIGQRVAETGDVLEVKVLGVVGLLDEGETDWKIIVIDAHDPLAEKLNCVQDVRREMPGFLEATLDWFKYYKVADGKGVNQIAFNDEVKDSDFAKQVIEETHEAWKKLISGAVSNKTEKCELAIAKAGDAGFEAQLNIGKQLPEAAKPAGVDKSYFIVRAQVQ